MSIVLSTTNHFMSRLIRKISRSTVSHASICIEVEGVPFIVEATTGGVRLIPRKTWERHAVVIREYDYLFSKDAIRFVLEEVHKKYDYLGLVGFVPVVLAWRWFRKKIKNPLSSSIAVVCSEFVARALNFGNKDFDLDPENTTPSMLLRICEKHNMKRKDI